MTFMGTTAAGLDWSFKPCAPQMKCKIGESSLAFFNIKNNTDRVMKGIATYDILPRQAGQYFNKIQCFCFDEQLLKPGESMDMPVLFIIDKEYENDPLLYRTNKVSLIYHFLEATDGLDIPLPNFMR